MVTKQNNQEIAYISSFVLAKKLMVTKHFLWPSVRHSSFVLAKKLMVTKHESIFSSMNDRFVLAKKLMVTKLSNNTLYITKVLF